MLEMGLGLILISFGVQALVGGVFLWVAMKMFGEEGRLVPLMVAYIIASIIAWIFPFGSGALLLLALLAYMVKRFTSAGTGVSIAISVIANFFAFGVVAVVIYLVLGEDLYFYYFGKRELRSR